MKKLSFREVRELAKITQPEHGLKCKPKPSVCCWHTPMPLSHFHATLRRPQSPQSHREGRETSLAALGNESHPASARGVLLFSTSHTTLPGLTPSTRFLWERRRMRNHGTGPRHFLTAGQEVRFPASASPPTCCGIRAHHFFLPFLHRTCWMTDGEIPRCF